MNEVINTTGRFEVWFRRIIYTGAYGTEKEWSCWSLICGYATEEIARSSMETFKRINHPIREYQIVPPK